MTLAFRPATLQDEKILFDWRNDPTVIAQLSNPRAVELKEHSRWLKSILSCTVGDHLYITELDGVPIGQGRIERNYTALNPRMDSCLIGYSIQKDYRGHGFGRQLVAFLVKEATITHGYATVKVRVKRTNIQSALVAMVCGVHAIELFP